MSYLYVLLYLSVRAIFISQTQMKEKERNAFFIGLYSFTQQQGKIREQSFFSRSFVILATMKRSLVQQRLFLHDFYVKNRDYVVTAQQLFHNVGRY